MLGHRNTCSRCRFFGESACASRVCYDWRQERSRPSRTPEPEDEERDEERERSRR